MNGQMIVSLTKCSTLSQFRDKCEITYGTKIRKDDFSFWFLILHLVSVTDSIPPFWVQNKPFSMQEVRKLLQFQYSEGYERLPILT